MRIQIGKRKVITTLKPNDRAVLDMTDGSVTFYRGSAPLVMDSENETAFEFTKNVVHFRQLCRVIGELFNLKVTTRKRNKAGTFAYIFTKA